MTRAGWKRGTKCYAASVRIGTSTATTSSAFIPVMKLREDGSRKGLETEERSRVAAPVGPSDTRRTANFGAAGDRKSIPTPDRLPLASPITMYQPALVRAPVSPIFVTLAHLAAQNHLVICAGAGLSVAEPCELPSGAQLARLVHTRLAIRIVVPPCDPDSLLSVADAVDAIAGGLEALQHELLRCADFESASPTYGHKVVAELALDGAVAVLLLNWDCCVERSSPVGAWLPVVVTAEDRAHLTEARVVKIHGCSTRPSSLLVSTRQLEDPPLWVGHTVGAQLNVAAVVFVGLSEVPTYAKPRLQRLVADINGVGRCRVVAPGVSASWAGSAWDELLPALPAENKHDDEADAFLDSLARALVGNTLAELHGVASARSPQAAEAVDRFRAAVGAMDVVSFMRWAREAAYRWRSGVTVLRSPELQEAMLALCLASQKHALQVSYAPSQSYAVANGITYGLIVSRGRTATQLAGEAQRRSEESRRYGRDFPGELLFLCVGNTEALDQPESLRDIVAEPSPDDVIDGTRAGRPRLLAAHEVLEGHWP